MSIRDKVKADAFSVVNAPTTEKVSTIIAEKSPLEKLESEVRKVNLINTLVNDLKDPLSKFRNESGAVDEYKVPQNLYIVAIIHEIIKASKRIHLGICVRHGVIYLFTGKYWQETADEDVKKLLSKLAIKLGYYSPATAKVSEFREKLFKQFLYEGVEEANTPERKNILVNLNNGTLEIDKSTVRLRERRREDFITYCLNYDYSEKAKCQIFENYLDEVLPKREVQMILQEYVGYIFTTGLKLEKGAVLYGSGANGKSVFFEIITSLLGKDNLSFKGLGDLCMKGDRGDNHRAEIENKLVNYASEISPKGADIEIFKALVSGEPVNARRLYKNVYTFRSNAKLIFNANKLPTETEHTEGFFRRYLIIPFNVTIPENRQDKFLHKKIIENELGGVLNWAIDGLKRLLSTGNFTESEETSNALEDFKKQSNSVLQFVEEYSLEKDEYGFVSNKDLYSSYTEFCNSCGYHRFNQSNFSQELKKAGFEARQKKVSGNNRRGFKIEFGG
jgi:putative DNA primase/helicase